MGQAEDSRRYRERHRDEIRERRRRLRQADPGKYREWSRRWREVNPGAMAEYSRRLRKIYRTAVFDHYGRSCTCCGTTDNLTIDHINGDGKEHRKEIGRGAIVFHRWLIENDFPPGFQTMCSRCNTSKAKGDRCRLDHATAVRQLVLAEANGGHPQETGTDTEGTS